MNVFLKRDDNMYSYSLESSIECHKGKKKKKPNKKEGTKKNNGNKNISSFSDNEKILNNSFGYINCFHFLKTGKKKKNQTIFLEKKYDSNYLYNLKNNSDHFANENNCRKCLSTKNKFSDKYNSKSGKNMDEIIRKKGYFQNKVFTIVNYDFIGVIKKTKNIKMIHTQKEIENKNIELISHRHDYLLHYKNEEEKKMNILKNIEKEQIPDLSASSISIEKEYILHEKKYKNIHIAFVKGWKKIKNQNIHYIGDIEEDTNTNKLKTKIIKIYKYPKEDIFNPFYNRYICFENSIKIEKWLTMDLKHENIISMESYFYYNGKIMTFYKYGGNSLMQWDKETKRFQYKKKVYTVNEKKKKYIIFDKKMAENKKEYYEYDKIWNPRINNDNNDNISNKRTKREKTYVYPEYMIAEILRQLLKACFYLYENQIYHSDIKPSNIVAKNIKKKNLNKIIFCKKEKKWYIKKYGKIKKNKILIKIIDFEYSQKCYGEEANVGGTTSLFKPLENFRKKKINIFSKMVWIIGITIFILSTGTHPFSSINNDMHVLFLIQNKNFDIKNSFSKYSYFSHSFKDLLQKMLKVEYTQRISFFDLFFHPFVLLGGD
ncbi:serine/threonine protein kinase, putative [Plasmodium berghei]|uniref:Serine/threonine protein kinase, putative n=2 Tax=Plasmodium berghei TaxID=5821 RepID=A0A509AJ14_PLABA|nr:serine/threonine protein kinase, putative [Plasmodium berghei ANKA]CXI35777.1 serine/threonine protein kinase, putative [Plasmodium berghei]SCM21536.1 serine/threonine protein kinase, putative [Plasmodium berghei]SCN24736.1 serine/threonine protein kinase, putative [Plasmodium berghei]SCO59874.1 serine/threonine protein kinase, putative [Plasmodium berghei]SCO61195.1 serine/threonine protein kinase, putative [Plasmodium berghei]|eukprot:XP_034421269.1 serine/threonine protein kinase, putative [Plasmodium berghei ANKA]